MDTIKYKFTKDDLVKIVCDELSKEHTFYISDEYFAPSISYDPANQTVTVLVYGDKKHD